MILPFHADTPTARVAWVNYALIAANGLVFLWLLQLTPQGQQSVTLHRGFIPARIGQLTDPRVITLFRDFPGRDPLNRPVLVRQKVAELPPDQAEAVNLSYVEGLSHSEIAERLGVPLGTVKSRMRLAYHKIRDALEELR